MTYENILFDIQESVCRVTFNRPAALNAVNGETGLELKDALERAANDKSVRVVVLTGAGRGFSSGGDVKEMTQLFGKTSDEHFHQLIGTLNDVTTLMIDMPKPVVAAVNGPVAGIAFNFALAADFRVAAKSAHFTQAFMKIGLIPDGGGTFLLPRVVGWGTAMDLFLTARTISSDEALRLGIVSQVFEDAEFPAAVEGIVRQLAGAPTSAIGHLKALMRASLHNDLATQLKLELETQIHCGRSGNFLEGITAFVEKRKPNFTAE